MHAICLPTIIPPKLNDIDDELKAIYHSSDSVCIWVFDCREDRNCFVEDSAGMTKVQRDELYELRMSRKA